MIRPVAAPARVFTRPPPVEPAARRNGRCWPTPRSPALVVGAGTDDRESWDALQALAERLDCPVWQEAFGGRAGYPQDHPLFAGHLPSGRSELRKALAEHDLILAIGAPVFRQYPYEDGPLVEPGTRIVVLTDDPDEANGGPADLAVVAHPAAVCAALLDRVRLDPRSIGPPALPDRPAPPAATRRCSPPRSSRRWPTALPGIPSSSRKARPAGRAAGPAAGP